MIKREITTELLEAAGENPIGGTITEHDLSILQSLQQEYLQEVTAWQSDDYHLYEIVVENR